MMKVLHIYKEVPDEIIKTIVEYHKMVAEIIEIRLYEEKVDYDRLIKAIEETDRVFTW